MGIGDAFRELGEFLEACERRERAVDGVEVAGCRGSPADGLSVDVELTLSSGSQGGDGNEAGCGIAACSPSIEPDGSVRLALESSGELIPAGDCGVSVDPTGATLGPDGTVTVAFSATVPAAGEPDDSGPVAEDSSGAETVAGETTPVGADDSDVPPFKNPDLLAEVYESCDTFAEMADSLGMDVTAETVRRYMIDYNIHQPNSYQTGTGDASDADGRTAGDDADGSQPVVLSDGIGLPDDVTVDHLIETVEKSNTIYEVKQDIGIDRQDALDMLQELNLLDLVVGRLATEAERDISRDDVVDRLREASATQ